MNHARFKVSAFAPAGEMSELEIVKHQLSLAQAEIERASREWERLRSAVSQVGTVCRMTGESRGYVVTSGGSMEMGLPAEAKVGSQLRILQGPEGPAALEAYAEPIAFGATVLVDRVIGIECFFVANNIDTSATIAAGLAINPGDRVRLDPTASVALQSLGPELARGYKVSKPTGVTWDDIGGQEAAKEMLREAIEYPVKHAALYKAYGQKPSNGALLYGPPGTGKTMLAKALLSSLGADTDGFIYLKGPEVLTRWRGESEAQIRALFTRARRYKEQTGTPAVIFIDEAEAVLSARGFGGLNDVSLTIVPAFLNEMDGMEESGAFVLLATNRPDILDPAVIREGRIDRKAKVDRPDRKVSRAIFELALRGRPCSSAEALAEHAVSLFHGDELALCEITFQDRGARERLFLRHALSGAFIAGVMQRATDIAIRRDREAGSSEPTGLGLSDVDQAIRAAHAELAAIEQTLLVKEHCKELGREPASVTPVKGSGLIITTGRN